MNGFLKKGIYKKCIICNKEFYVIQSRKDKAKFCSYECYWKNLNSRKLKDEHKTNCQCAFCRDKNGVNNSFFGRKHTELSKKIIREKTRGIMKYDIRGDKNPSKRPEVLQKMKDTCTRMGHYEDSSRIMKENSPMKNPLNVEKMRLSKIGKYGGEKHWNWKDGITPKNMKIRNDIESRLWRNLVFARDNFTCQKYKTRGEKLAAHHIQNFSQYSELRFVIDNGITFSDKAHREFHKIYGFRNNTGKQVNEFLLQKQ